MTKHVLKSKDSDGWHFETIQGVSQCGKALNIESEAVLREAYQPAHPADLEARHGTLCTDCHLLNVGLGELR